ncbi:hypothetical protein HDU91_000748, partial [Kappamyces sp. JEL0680]
MMQPCVSVWSVLALPDGDIVVAGSDGAIRVFSRTPSRQATRDEIQSFDALVASSEIPSSHVGDINKSKLPGVEALGTPGKKEGEIKMVLEGNVVEAYQWSATSAAWQKIGQVVDAVGANKKQVFMGKEYDYVFDVDLETGAPPLKLPYNTSENPYMAAQAFIDRNDLSQSFLDEIANFIIANAKSVTLGETQHGFSDPFTGGGRYIPHGSSASPSKNSPLIPTVRIDMLMHQTDFVLFKSANLPAIYKKLEQINALVGDRALSATQLGVLRQVCTKFESGNYAERMAPEGWAVLQQVGLEWPAEHRFPGIDLIRFAVLHSGTDAQTEERFHSSLWSNLGAFRPFSKTLEVNLMLTLRVFCNSFKNSQAPSFIQTAKPQLLSELKTVPSLSQNSNLLNALTTFYLNLIISSAAGESSTAIVQGIAE